MARVERNDSDYNIYLSHDDMVKLTLRKENGVFPPIKLDVKAYPPRDTEETIVFFCSVDSTTFAHPEFSHDGIYFEPTEAGPLVMVRPSLLFNVDRRGSFGTRYDGFENKVNIFREDIQLEEGEIKTIYE